MDIVAHGLWAGIGVALAQRRWSVPPRTAAATVALGVLPDLAHVMPLLGIAFTGPQGLALLRDYAIAVPGAEPALPPLVQAWSHHLHCIGHSAVIAAAVTLLLWWATRSLWLPLLGWWSHIVIDVLTHSDDFYPSPVLYPFTRSGFDGLAWNTPWFTALNYTAIAVALVALWATRPRHGRSAEAGGGSRPAGKLHTLWRRRVTTDS